MASAYLEAPSERFRQGDVLRDVEIVTWAEEVDGELVINSERLDYCVVLTQECDLEQDFTNRHDVVRYEKNHDKILPSLLLCPAFPASQLREGIHLQDQTVIMQKINSNDWKRVTQNNNYRYHYLPENQNRQVPELVLDFKRYITVPRDVAYRDIFKGMSLYTT